MPRGQKNVDRQNQEIGRHNPQGAAREESAQVDRLFAGERRKQLTANQVTAESEKKIDPDPTPAIHSAGHRKAHEAGVINDDHDDRERAKKVEARLAFAILKARIDC